MTLAASPFCFVFPALLLHQFEEYIWPGGFARWINREVFGRPDSEQLFTRRIAFVINVPLAWPLALLVTWRGTEWLSFSLLFCGILLVNSWFHTVLAITKLQYNPGAVSSVLVILPLMLWVLVDAIKIHGAGLGLVLCSVLGGLMFHIGVTTLPRLRSQASGG